MFLKDKFFVFLALTAIFIPVINSDQKLRHHGSTIIRKRKIDYNTPLVCSIKFRDDRKNVINDVQLPIIYYITPTYPRPEQIPELTRLSHSLMHVPRIHWIVADDRLECSKPVTKLLKRTGLAYSHISSPKPNTKRYRPVPLKVIPRGVANRKAALNWLQMFHKKQGVLYFGDDDNTVDLELFDEIRKTKKLSMFPVGLIGFYGVSSPVVKDGKVIGFFDSWLEDRTFPVDMAGFAINMKYLKNNAMMPYEAGMLEDKFLTSSGFKMEDIEPLAENCTKVLVWHTQTRKNAKRLLKGDLQDIGRSKYENLGKLLRELARFEVISFAKRYGTKAIVLDRSLGQVIPLANETVHETTMRRVL